MQNIKTLFLNNNKELCAFMCTKEIVAQAESFDLELNVSNSSGEKKDLEESLNDCEAIITSWGSPVIDKALLAKAEKVKIIGHAAGSVASVITSDVYERGIKVITANSVMAETVAEWVLMVTLIALRNPEKYAKWFSYSGLRWDAREDCRDLASSTIGVWGLGDIAKKFISLLKPLKPKRILVFSNHASIEQLAMIGAEKATWEEIFSESDVIHLLAGLTPNNIGKVGVKELKLIKDGATLVNGGRANLIEKEPLISELKRGRIKAIFDVLYNEPPIEGDPLFALKNIVVTPHNAAAPGTWRYVPFILEEFQRYFAGKEIASEVSRDRFTTMTVEKLAHA